MLAREDGGETEKNREEERKRRAETMTAARHDRIVILSRMAHIRTLVHVRSYGAK